jgi:ATP-dependent protease ClpP protease subunit
MEAKQGVFLRAMAADGKEAVIDIVGVIGWEVGYQQLKSIIAAVPPEAERVVFDIYSPGGDVWEGNAILHEIGAMKQETVARVRVAASMATLIAVACKTREMNANGRWLIHNPWTQVMGDAATLEKRAKELRDCEVEAAEFYAARTGNKPEAMIDLMAEERWLTADEAKQLGFVGAVIDPFEAQAYAGVRDAMEKAGKWPKALAIADPEPEPVAVVANPHDTQTATTDAAPHVAETKPKPEEVKSEDAKPDGAAVVAEPDAASADAATSVADAIIAAEAAGYERGFSAGKTECALEVSDKVDDLNKRLTVTEAERRKLQGERDAANAKVVEAEKRRAKETEELRKHVDELTARLNKLTLGSLAFSRTIETWEEALRECGGKYSDAAAKYPDLLKEFIRRHRR